jgi:hypothetical protein
MTSRLHVDGSNVVVVVTDNNDDMSLPLKNGLYVSDGKFLHPCPYQPFVFVVSKVPYPENLSVVGHWFMTNFNEGVDTAKFFIDCSPESDSGTLFAFYMAIIVEHPQNIRNVCEQYAYILGVVWKHEMIEFVVNSGVIKPGFVSTICEYAKEQLSVVLFNPTNRNTEPDLDTKLEVPESPLLIRSDSSSVKNIVHFDPLTVWSVQHVIRKNADFPNFIILFNTDTRISISPQNLKHSNLAIVVSPKGWVMRNAFSRDFGHDIKVKSVQGTATTQKKFREGYADTIVLIRGLCQKIKIAHSKFIHNVILMALGYPTDLESFGYILGVLLALGIPIKDIKGYDDIQGNIHKVFGSL